MVTMTTDSVITEEHLPDFLISSEIHQHDKIEHQHQRPYFKEDHDIGLLSTTVRQTESELIAEVIDQAKNKSEAIKILGISRRTFYTKLKQYGLG